MYKVYHMQLPQNLQVLFNFSRDLDSYKLRSHDRFQVSYARTNSKYMYKCISVYGVSFFNSLPSILTSTKNVFQFKKRYTAYLIEKYSLF